MIEKMLTINPTCMSYQSGTWRNDLTQAGTYQQRMAAPTEEPIMAWNKLPKSKCCNNQKHWQNRHKSLRMGK